MTASYLRTYLVPVCLYRGPCQRSLGVVTPGEVSTSDQDTRSTSWRCGVDDDAKHEDIGGAIENDGTGYFNDHQTRLYDSIAGVGKTGVWLRADFQSGSRVLKKVF